MSWPPSQLANLSFGPNSSIHNLTCALAALVCAMEQRKSVVVVLLVWSGPVWLVADIVFAIPSHFLSDPTIYKPASQPVHLTVTAAVTLRAWLAQADSLLLHNSLQVIVTMLNSAQHYSLSLPPLPTRMQDNRQSRIFAGKCVMGTTEMIPGSCVCCFCCSGNYGRAEPFGGSIYPAIKCSFCLCRRE